MKVNLNKIERIKDAVETISGSGINYDYTFEVGYSHRYGIYIEARNAYDVMNEAGFYTDTVRFVVRVPVEKTEDFAILLPAKYYDCDGLKNHLAMLYVDVLVR
jgi:hypothetical protein